jgi:hypothetical protein
MTTFHATLNSLAGVLAVVVGTSAGVRFNTSPVNHFVNGSIRFNSKDDYVGYQESDGTTINWPAPKGELKFWMRPRFYDTNTEKYTFFQRGLWLTPGMLEFGKHATSNNNTFRLIAIDADGERVDQEIAQSSWAAQLDYNVWSQIRITYDWTVASGVQCCHIYINDVEMPIIKTSMGSTVLPGPLSGPQSFVPARVGEYFYLGGRGPNSPFRANMDAKDLMLSSL